jgi:AcrR family transcriptional regulator
LRTSHCENIVLEVKNAILKQRRPHGPVAARSARRAIARREARHDDAVRRLVAASFALIRETGSLEPSVAAIVERAGLSNQAFYRHFESKDELLLGVLDEGFRCSRAISRTASRRRRAPRRRSARGSAACSSRRCSRVGGGHAAVRGVARAARGAVPDEVARRSALVAPLRDALAEAVASGALPHADPERDAAGDLHARDRLGAARAVPREPRTRAEAEHLVEFALAALRARGGLAWSARSCSRASAARASSSRRRCSRARRSPRAAR